LICLIIVSAKKIINDIKKYKLEQPEDIWSLSEMLKEHEKEINQIYDYRYSQLVMVFAILIKRGFFEYHRSISLCLRKYNKCAMNYFHYNSLILLKLITDNNLLSLQTYSVCYNLRKGNDGPKNK
jgi:hypothetical protein